MLLSLQKNRRIMNPRYNTVIPKLFISSYFFKMLDDGIVQKVPGKTLEWLGHLEAMFWENTV